MPSMRFISTVILLIALAFSSACVMAADSTPPQYLFLNRAPGPDWYQNNPETITDKLFLDPFVSVSRVTDGKFVIGQSFVFSCLNGPPAVIQDSLRRILATSQRLKVPVLIVLDCQNWWDYRTDLWNWWDVQQKGYNPLNVQNVEWTGPGPQYALKGAWRNWGRQVRVVPPPNLYSPAFRAASKEAIVPMLAILKEWFADLPAGEKYLFPGVKLGWEASVGINAYSYPDGSKFFEPDAAGALKEPDSGLELSRGLFGGLQPQGYSALTAMGRKPGVSYTVTRKDLEDIAGGYLNFLCSLAHRAGFNRRYVFTHAGGQFAPYDQHVSHGVAMNEYATPGWSLYGVMPDKAGDLAETLRKHGVEDWCAAEWLPAASTAAEWSKSILETLEFKHCRFISVYNWEGIRGNSAALEGIELARSAPVRH